ncbi:MAG: Uncharacterised protein [Owenweeksia sp. TMED14]|nr:MAG: Uncharacterised protein [Owenweeksia sp. TMED14]|tara:strand:+ start:3624 stop:4541 length:918 start_codon:yes stop_codon:yes gene_type:complete
MKKYAQIYFIAFALISCERIIPFSPEDTDPKMTIYSLASVTGYGVGFGVMTDSLGSDPIDAVVSRSVGILDNSNPIFLDAATLWVIDINTSEIDTLISLGAEGRYRAPNMKVKSGHVYNLHGKQNGLDTIFASSNVPNVPMNIIITPGDTSLGGGAGPGGGGDKPSISFELEIEDDGGPGYYMIEAYEREINTTGVLGSRVWMDSDDPSFNSANNRWGSERLYVSNELFLGNKRTFSLKVIGYPEPDVQKLFKITKMGNDYFYFLSSSDLYFNTGGPFSQPVSVYSNISNGLGVFSGTSAMWFAP